MKPIPKPTSPLLPWMLANEEAIIEAFAVLEKLRTLRVHLVAPEGAPQIGTDLVEAEDNMILALPIQFSATINAPSGGATIDTQCRAAVVSILTALARTNQLPST